MMDKDDRPVMSIPVTRMAAEAEFDMMGFLMVWLSDELDCIGSW
jgi:hypothetical protein